MNDKNIDSQWESMLLKTAACAYNEQNIVLSLSLLL